MKRILIMLMALAMLAGLYGCAGAEEIPGVLADFTEQASAITNEDTRSYTYCYYDWDEDGEDELFFLQAFDNGDGKWPMNAAVYSGPELSDTRWTPPKKFDDVAQILTVCFIDIDPADGAKDLVISVAAPDGTEQTMMIRGVLTDSDSQFGEMWMDPRGNKILSGRFNGLTDGKVIIGDAVYAQDEKYWLKESELPDSDNTGTSGSAADPEITDDSAQPEKDSEAGIQTEVKYTAVTMSVNGYEAPASLFGEEYSIVFHADGTVTFIAGGNEMPGLTWTADGTDFVIQFYDAGEIRVSPGEEGIVLDYLGTMLIKMNG